MNSNYLNNVKYKRPNFRNIKIDQNRVIRLTNADPVSINLPESPSRFMQQIINGRRLKCHGKYVVTAFESGRIIPFSKLHIFEDIRRNFEKIGIVPFLLSGSLLGERLIKKSHYLTLVICRLLPRLLNYLAHYGH